MKKGNLLPTFSVVRFFKNMLELVVCVKNKLKSTRLSTNHAICTSTIEQTVFEQILTTLKLYKCYHLTRKIMKQLV